MKTVIAAVDFSTGTNRVAGAAIGLARLRKGKVSSSLGSPRPR